MGELYSNVMLNFAQFVPSTTMQWTLSVIIAISSFIGVVIIVSLSLYWYYVSIPAGNDVRNPVLAMLVHSVADLEAGTCRTSKYASRSEDSAVDIWLLVCVFRLCE